MLRGPRFLCAHDHPAEAAHVANQGLAEFLAHGMDQHVNCVALHFPPPAVYAVTLTGSETLSTEEIARLASQATGKPLSVVHVTDGQLATGLKAAGVPEIFVSVLVSAEAEMRAGNLSIVTDHVESLIARAPRRLAEYLKEVKSAFGA